MEMAFLLWIVAIALILTGLAGLLLPVLPGAALILLGLVLAAWAENFQYVGAGTLALISVLGCLLFAVDFIAGALGAKHFGASPRAAVGAAIGALAGFWFGPIGVFVGPFVGAVLGELSAKRTLEEAGRAGVGATLGLVLGVAVKLALALTMIGVFLFARFLV
jgi:uncharacterized protein YqgC (DUF456 family)